MAMTFNGGRASSRQLDNNRESAIRELADMPQNIWGALQFTQKTTSLKPAVKANAEKALREARSKIIEARQYLEMNEDF